MNPHDQHDRGRDLDPNRVDPNAQRHDPLARSLPGHATSSGLGREQRQPLSASGGEVVDNLHSSSASSSHTRAANLEETYRSTSPGATSLGTGAHGTFEHGHHETYREPYASRTGGVEHGSGERHHDDHSSYSRRRVRSSELSHMNSDEIRERIAETRSAMDRTVDELAYRLKPRTILEEFTAIADFDSDTGAQLRARARRFGSRFVEQIEQQPVPAALIGLGIAWMAFGGRSDEPVRDSYYDAETGRWRERAGGISGKASSAWHRTKDSASSMMHGARSGISDAAGRARSGASSIADRARSGASAAGSAAERAKRGLHNAASSVRHGAVRARDTIGNTLEESPMMIGAGALALGLLAGMVLPHTRREDRAFGDEADELKDRARTRAKGAVERAGDVATSAAKSAANAAVDAARTETERKLGHSSSDPGRASGDGNPSDRPGSSGF